MQLQQKMTAVDARAVALDMTMLLAYALLSGVVVSVLVAVPVVLLSANAS